MNTKTSPITLVALSAALLAGCGSAQLPEFSTAGDREAAERVLRRSIEAHGGAARWSAVDDVVVRYEGEWAKIGPRIQPVLADTGYRRASTEVVFPRERVIWQAHEGPEGTKRVLRTPDTVEVVYDEGAPVTDENMLDAGALAADAYQMFLTGPFFFAAHATTLRWAGTETVDGELCDRITAVVRHGFGRTEEDLALLSIGRESGILRRVRLTLNGMESTRGAEVDVTFRGHREIDGILWATKFVERIRAPFRLAAHEWRLVSIETNTGAESDRPASLTESLQALPSVGRAR